MDNDTIREIIDDILLQQEIMGNISFSKDYSKRIIINEIISMLKKEEKNNKKDFIRKMKKSFRENTKQLSEIKRVFEVVNVSVSEANQHLCDLIRSLNIND